MRIIGGQPPVVPMPDFEDAFKTQQVLEAAMVSAEQKRSVSIDEMK
jgi:predicted dehydrogenase